MSSSFSEKKERFVGVAQSRGLTNLPQVDLNLYLPFFFLFPLFSISPPPPAPLPYLRLPRRLGGSGLRISLI